jgi:hypothetical protein
LRFVGLDASPACCNWLQQNLRAAGVHNVSLQQGDMTVLDGVAASTDVVLCTMSLHHLADVTACSTACFRCGASCARMAGCIWQILAGSSAGPRSASLLTAARCSRPQFTADFLNSMQAAFSLAELQQAAACWACSGLLPHGAGPFMVVLRSAGAA